MTVPSPVLRATPDVTCLLYPPGGQPRRLEPLLDTIRYSTAAVGGFGACSFSLPGVWTARQLPFLSMVRLFHGDSLLWEGRVEDLGLRISEGNVSTEVQAFGLSRLLNDTSVRTLWVQRDPDFVARFVSVGNWQTTFGAFDPTDLSRHGIRMVTTEQTISNTEYVYMRDSGIRWQRIIFTLTAVGANVRGYFRVGDVGSIPAELLTDGTYDRTVIHDPEENLIRLGAGFTASFAGTGNEYVEFENIRIFATGRPPADQTDGFYGGTILRDLAMITPGLTAGLIEDGNDFVVENLERLVRTSVLSVVEEVANYYSREWGVWEGGRLDWITPALDEPQWVCQLADLDGLELDTSVDGLGRTKYLLFTDATIGDATNEKTAASVDQRNPYVRTGATRDVLVTPGFPMTPNSAQQLATKLAAESGTYPPAAGRITIAAERLIRDAKGTPQPAYRVRGGDNILIADLPKDDPFTAGRDGQTLFHIVSTDVDLNARAITLEVEGQTRRSDILLARLAAVTRTVTG